MEVDKQSKPTSSSPSLPSRPTLPASELCCQTGCENCVYLLFAEELIKYCQETGKDTRSELETITSDTTIKGMIDMLIKEASLDDSVTKDNEDEKNK